MIVPSPIATAIPEPRRYQWVLALLFALAAHFALAKLLESPAPIELDDPGIRISLGGTGPAGGDGAADAVKSIPAAADAVESIPSAVTLAATSAATAIQAVSAPATATETIRAAEPAPPVPITAAEPSSPKPKVKTVHSRETPPPPIARAAPKPKNETGPKTTPRPTSAKPASVDANATGNASGKPGAGGGGAAGNTDGGKSKDRYYAELAAWLERHKRYPAQARKLRQEGIVGVRFVLDRSGKVISHRIETSSGHTALDHAASELLRRASPMPAIPASMGQSRLEIVVPIAYRLR